ncbi:MAG: aminoglycoside phosphotransferase family protein, partial [Anaerolineales bacterium]
LADGRTAEVYAWGDNQIVKLYREGWTRRTAEFEYRQALASQQTGYRVPQVERVIDLDGRIGIIYQRVDGPTMLAVLRQKMYRFPYFARQMADLHAEMHTKPASGLEPVHERLAGKIAAVAEFSGAEKDDLHTRLFQLPQEDKLLHGDFHPDNILLTGSGPVIIDWIDATLGHPLADVARTTVIFRFGVPPEEKIVRLLIGGITRIYLRRYFRESPYTQADLDAWLLVVAAGRLSENIPHEREPLLAFVRNRLAAAR